MRAIQYNVLTMDGGGSRWRGGDRSHIFVDAHSCHHWRRMEMVFAYFYSLWIDSSIILTLCNGFDVAIQTRAFLAIPSNKSNEMGNRGESLASLLSGFACTWYLVFYNYVIKTNELLANLIHVREWPFSVKWATVFFWYVRRWQKILNAQPTFKMLARIENNRP